MNLETGAKQMELIFWALMATENGFGDFLLFKKLFIIKIPFRKGKVHFSNFIGVCDITKSILN